MLTWSLFCGNLFKIPKNGAYKEEQAFRLGSCFGSGMRKGQVCGSCICNEILGYDITTPEGLKKVREKGLFSSVCPKMVANATDILEEIIKDRE